MPPIISTVADSYKKPAFIGETIFGAGAASLQEIPLVLLCVGLKDTAAAGTAALDTEVFDCPDVDTADTKAKIGSELNRMLRAALRIRGVRVKGLAVTPNASAVAGTATITIGGTWSAAGSV